MYNCMIAGKLDFATAWTFESPHFWLNYTSFVPLVILGPIDYPVYSAELNQTVLCFTASDCVVPHTFQPQVLSGPNCIL